MNENENENDEGYPDPDQLKIDDLETAQPDHDESFNSNVVPEDVLADDDAS